jgi:translation initiation factor 5B
MVVHPEDDLEELMEECQSDLARVTKSLTTDARGVTVHASTLGALEALLQFLREDTRPPIPVCHVSIGPVNKKDVVRTSIALEKGQPEFAVILAFDVRVDAEAQGLADELKVRIFTADIIYHLFDQFTAHLRALVEARRAAAELLAVHPCVLRILPQHIFNKKDPIVLGVEVLEGTLRLGTPLCVPGKGLDVGRVISIENNHKEVTVARRSLSVSVKIVNEADPSITYGRHFDASNTLYSKLTRQSIDALKEFFKE